MNTYQAQGAGTDYLPYPALQYLLIDDPFLGTSQAGVPDGPFNRELNKLLLNDSALANLFAGYLSRTFGSSTESAPTVGTVPEPMPGAPLTPADMAQHVVFFTDFEVYYQYDGTAGEWVEQTRIARAVAGGVIKHTAQVQITLTDQAGDYPITLPTVDDNAQAFTFQEMDVKNVIVTGLSDAGDGLLTATVLGVNSTSPVLRVTVDTSLAGESYVALINFENIEIL